MNVRDVGPALYKCYANVLCSLGSLYSQWRIQEGGGGWGIRRVFKSSPQKILYNAPLEALDLKITAYKSIVI